jgi:hypothetical protein
MNKKRVAREWLHFLACTLFGLTVMPFLVFLVFIVFFFPDRHNTLAGFFGGFYSALAGMEEQTVTACLIVAAPYVSSSSFVQAVRTP